MTIARAINESCRDSDVFARLGGDEFAILLINTSTFEARNVVYKLQELIKTLIGQRSNEYIVAFSYGIVDFSSSEDSTIEALLEKGDRAMYEQKKNMRCKKLISQGNA